MGITQFQKNAKLGALIYVVPLCLFLAGNAGAQLTPVSQSRSVTAAGCTVSASDFGPFSTNLVCSTANASQNSVITSSNILASGSTSQFHSSALSSMTVTCDVAVTCFYSLTGSIYSPPNTGGALVRFSNSTGDIYVVGISSPSGPAAFAASGMLPAGRYAIFADAFAQQGISAGGEYNLNLTFTAVPPELRSVFQQGNDMLLTWTTPPGTNRVQVTNGAADGSYSNNFATIGLPIIIPGGSNVTIVTTNYLDVGGATNQPSRFYRVQLLQ